MPRNREDLTGNKEMSKDSNNDNDGGSSRGVRGKKGGKR
jgi:hypothetical protein